MGLSDAPEVLGYQTDRSPAFDTQLRTRARANTTISFIGASRRPTASSTPAKVALGLPAMPTVPASRSWARLPLVQGPTAPYAPPYPQCNLTSSLVTVVGDHSEARKSGARLITPKAC